MPRNLALEAANLISQERTQSAIVCLQKAIKQLRNNRLQRLPPWVKPGALLQWTGEPPHDVYRVYSITLPTRPHTPWIITLKSTKNEQHIMTIYQERGRRYWRKYRGHAPKEKNDDKRRT